MEYRKITALIRAESWKPSNSACPGRGRKAWRSATSGGYGEYANFFARDWQDSNMRLEIFTEASKVDAVVGAIMEAASTGGPGDGMIAVLPVDSVCRIIRRQAPVQTEEL